MPDEIAELSAPAAIVSAAQIAVGPILHGVTPPGLPPCELRWERAVVGEAQGQREIVCMAAAGTRLALVGGDEGAMRRVCGSCTVPAEAARRPCLSLVPFKTEREGRPRDYFACRWFYKLKSEDPWTTTGLMCPGCIYWFPRPPLELLRDLEFTTRDIIQYHHDAWEGRLPPSPFAGWNLWRPASVPLWKQVLHRLASWLWLRVGTSLGRQRKGTP